MKKRTKRTQKSIQVTLNQSLWFALTVGADACPCFRLNHVKTRNEK